MGETRRIVTKYIVSEYRVNYFSIIMSYRMQLSCVFSDKTDNTDVQFWSRSTSQGASQRFQHISLDCQRHRENHRKRTHLQHNDSHSMLGVSKY